MQATDTGFWVDTLLSDIILLEYPGGEIIVDNYNGYSVIYPKRVGDVNLDGEIDVIDCAMVRRHTVKYITFTEEQRKLADVNGDGKVNTIDANYIRRYAAKLLSVFPVERK